MRMWDSSTTGDFAHSPDRKIENFIRTKYESKRWIMEGPMPDPSTLDEEGDDNVVSTSKDFLRLSH